MSADDCPVSRDGLRCELIRGHRGRHKERWVAMWSVRWEPILWFDVDSGRYSHEHDPLAPEPTES